MEKAAGQTTSWLNAGFVASNMRKPILRSMPTSGKHGRLSKAMYISTTLSAVIQQSTIRHPHHIIIRHCWLIMMLNGCPSQLSYIYRFIIKCLNFCLDNWTTIVLYLTHPHVCRHTYCSNMARSGMNPKALQYLMGHSDIGVTLNTYTHLGLEDAKVEMRRIASIS